MTRGTCFMASIATCPVSRPPLRGHREREAILKSAMVTVTHQPADKVAS